MQNVNLQGSPRLIVLKLSVATMEHLPVGIELRENVSAKQDVPSTSTGVIGVLSKESSSICTLIESMRAEYVLVEAFCEKSRGGKYAVQLTFCKKAYAVFSAGFALKRRKIMAGFKSLCKSSMWSVRVYADPYTKDGAKVPGAYLFSINCNGRKSLLEQNGQPIMVWPRTPDGARRMDGGKIPLQPNHVFRLTPKPTELAAVA